MDRYRVRYVVRLAGGYEYSRVARMLRFAEPVLIRFRTGRVRNVSGHSRTCRFALHHSLRQPLIPLEQRLAMSLLPHLFKIARQFAPGNNDRAAEEVID